MQIGPRADGARNYSQCDSMLIGDTCGANTFPYIRVQNNTAKVEHEAIDLEDRRGPAVLLRRAAASTARQAVSMIINGFVKDVFTQLPMEFAVEAGQACSA